MTSTTPIDHLSSLPPELIQKIFDSVFEDWFHPFRPFVLSKYLLPFSLAANYRNFQPKSWKQLEYVARSPFATLVKRLSFRDLSELDESWDPPPTIAPFVNLRLIWASTHPRKNIRYFWNEVENHPETFQHVTYLSCCIVSDELRLLRHFPSLVDLFFDAIKPAVFPRSMNGLLPCVRSLEIYHEHTSWWSTEDVIRVVTSCPSLKVFVMEECGPLFFPGLLHGLPTQLEELILRLEGLNSAPSLSRFNHLTSLTLGNRIPPFLGSAILDLPQLERLSLYGDSDLLPVLEGLVDGIDRLDKLNFLCLNFEFWGDMTWLEVDYTHLPAYVEELPNDLRVLFDGWSPAEFNRTRTIISALEDKDFYLVHDFEEVELAQRSYIVELNNRSVIKAYYMGAYEDLVEARNLANDYGFSLPAGIDGPPSDGSQVKIVNRMRRRLGGLVLSLRRHEENAGEDENAIEEEDGSEDSDSEEEEDEVTVEEDENDANDEAEGRDVA